jgi:hypothetical protein
MSKESGLVVPAVGLLFALGTRRLQLAAVTGSIILLYLGFRTLIFGSDAASYSQDGYMFFGWQHYDRASELPLFLRYLSFAENILKNALAPILPIFDDGGAVLSPGRLFLYSLLIVPTALLGGLVWQRRITHLQTIALLLLLVNAVPHFALFRVRVHYLSHAAFCIFVASSPLLGETRKRATAAALAVLLLAGSVLFTSATLNRWMLERNGAFEALEVEGTERYGDVAQEVLNRYR